jgi:hypothetical protein
MIQFLTDLQEESKGATPIPRAAKKRSDDDDLDEVHHSSFSPLLIAHNP